MLERRDGGKVALLARVLQLLERLVRAIYIRLVMLVVMELHDLRGDMRLERSVVVWKIRKRVLGHERTLLLKQFQHGPGSNGTVATPAPPVPLRNRGIPRPTAGTGDA